ncbi:MAG: CHASE2 domain-containing protein, partial [Candidatus Omnitrophica bacterium]|nr:CHASE2 domain-containing protein [Candidatus Omnitrophota bacterium]
SGLINKLQDNDGITRSGLTYLISTNPENPLRFFSWELRLLEMAGGIQLDTLQDEGNRLIAQGSTGLLRIPVDPATKTFWIRFQAHTNDFDRVSFVDVFHNTFDSNLIRGRIVLIGFLTEMFQDLHRTPIGWLPGLTLNANAFLTLWKHQFLKPLPQWVEWILFALAMALAAGLLCISRTLNQAAAWLAVEIAGILILIFALFEAGYKGNDMRLLLAVTWMGLLGCLQLAREKNRRAHQRQHPITM